MKVCKELVFAIYSYEIFMGHIVPSQFIAATSAILHYTFELSVS